MARFDWYQATVRAEVRPLVEALGVGVATDRATAWEPLSRAPYGYGQGLQLVDVDGVVCQAWWGGRHERPHVVGTGEAAPEVAEVLRGGFEHSVSRADVCEDYDQAGAYDRLQDAALVVAQCRSIRVGCAGDHLVTKQGRTLYLGAPSSHTRLRLYDKAAELRGQYRNDVARLASVPDHLARLEVQVRPQTREAKAAASKAAPVELMGSAAWSRELLRMVAGLELEPFEAGRRWRQADDARAWAAVLAQYGGLFQRLRNDLGSWECVGLQLGQDLADRAHAKVAR